MDGTAQLLSNIQFSEAKKGYDRDQVDNFLRELGKQVGKVQDMLIDATRRAEIAEAKASEAVKALATAVTQAEKAEAEAKAAKEAAAAAPAAPVNDIEAASGVLALAQKTADAAIEDAETKAKEIVADARTRAATLVVEAEQEIERIKQRASEQVDTMVAKRSAEVDADIDRLGAERSVLEAEVARLRAVLDEQRTRIQSGIESLSELLSDGGALASEDETDAVADTVEPAPVEAPADPPVNDVADAASSDAEPAVDGTDTNDDDEWKPLVADVETEAPSDPGPVIVTLEDLTVDAVVTPTELPPLQVADLLEAPSMLDAPTPANGKLIDLTGEHDIVVADGATGDAVDGEATQAYDVLAEADDEPTPRLQLHRPDVIPEPQPTSPTTAAMSSTPRVTATVDSSLGAPDADADEAMRAFFEQDFDAKDGKGRFGRRK